MGWLRDLKREYAAGGAAAPCPAGASCAPQGRPDLSEACGPAADAWRDPDLEAVIGGADERRTVRDVEIWPWRVFCLLTIVFGPRQWGIGSGVLIAPNLILTAAHNLWALGLRRTPEVTAHIGVNGDAQGAQARVVRAHLCPGYRGRHVNDPDQFACDYAVAELQSDALHRWAGQTLDVASIPVLADGDFARVSLNVAGYPHEDDQRFRLKTAFGRVLGDGLSRTNFRYRMDTFKGQSGCPVFHYDPATERTVYAGVHVAGSRSQGYNLARRFDAKMQANVKAWIDRLG